MGALLVQPGGPGFPGVGHPAALAQSRRRPGRRAAGHTGHRELAHGGARGEDRAVPGARRPADSGDPRRYRGTGVVPLRHQPGGVRGVHDGADRRGASGRAEAGVSARRAPARPGVTPVRVLVVADEVVRSLGPESLGELRPDLLIACGDLPFDYLEYLLTVANVPLLYVP